MPPTHATIQSRRAHDAAERLAERASRCSGRPSRCQVSVIVADRRAYLIGRRFGLACFALTAAVFSACDPILEVVVESNSNQPLIVRLRSEDLGVQTFGIGPNVTGLAIQVPDLDRAPITAEVLTERCQMTWAGTIPEGGGWLRIADDLMVTVGDSSDGFPAEPATLQETDRC